LAANRVVFLLEPRRQKNLATVALLLRGAWSAQARYGLDNQIFGEGPLSLLGLAAILPIEPLDSAGGVNEFLLAGKERMAARTYFQPYFGFGRSSLPGFSTGTVDGWFYVLGM